MRMTTTTIGAYPKPDYVEVPDWFGLPSGPDTEVPTRGWAEPVAARSAPGGLRFAEDIGGVRELDDEAADRRAPARRGRRGRRPAAASERPQPTRRESRRFEVEDEEIEEGLSELDEELEENSANETESTNELE